MNFAQNQSLKIFLTGLLILTIAMVIVYKYNYSQTLKNELHHTKFIVDEYSERINQLILEKVNTIKTITVSPVLITALSESNNSYSLLSEQKRNAEIKSKDDKWQTIKDNNDPFILKYTNNPASKYLVNQQNNLEGEYGEIYLTNKYGSLVASTAKLTILAHCHKYWWKEAFNDGIGAVFFDDRGYDESVGGYVLGIVVPIKSGDEIIGILKANLNILGSISELIINSQNERLGKLKLIRSDGLVIFEEGVEPLSKRISSEILEKLHSADEHSYICLEHQDKRLIGISEIVITSGIEGYGFGGSFESIDHKKGNTGESWELLSYRPISILVKPIHSTLTRLLFIGLFLSIVLAIISLIFGKRAAKPIRDLIEQTDNITRGDFNSNVIVRRKDEIGLLATSFNKMAKNLKNSTTSIFKLNKEINNHKKTEKLLHESENRLSSIFRVAPTGIGVVVNRIIKFVNQRFIEMTGYSAEELIGKNAQIIYPSEEEYKRVGKYKYKQIKKYGTGSIETQFLRKDGLLVDVLLSSTPLDLDDLSKGVTFTATDITEHVQTEYRIKTILDTAADGMRLIDREFNILKVNKTFLEILELPEEEVLGKKCYDVFWGKLCDTKDCPLIKLKKTKEDKIVTEILKKRKDGKEIMTILTATPFRDHQGIFTGIVEDFRDITTRKLIEEENKNKSKELEIQFEKSEKQRIATTIVLNDLNETTKKLKVEIIEHKVAEEKIKRNLNEKNTLLQELYHRTKNNMQIISSMLKMQSRNIENRTMNGSANIDFMHDSFNDVINKIKAMSLVHQKLYQAEDLSHINLKEYIKDLVNLLMISYGIRSESLSLKLDLKDVFVLIDSAIPLGLVLNELISNVFKHAFTNDGNDKMSILLFQDKDSTINIHLSDNGTGIPSDINLENVNTMGLQTVFNLIKYQLKGEITYKSDKGLKWDIKLKDNLHHERV